MGSGVALLILGEDSQVTRLRSQDLQATLGALDGCSQDRSARELRSLPPTVRSSLPHARHLCSSRTAASLSHSLPASSSLSLGARNSQAAVTFLEASVSFERRAGKLQKVRKAPRCRKCLCWTCSALDVVTSGSRWGSSSGKVDSFDGGAGSVVRYVAAIASSTVAARCTLSCRLEAWGGPQAGGIARCQ